ncbi:MAG TPA: hypothetical protein VHB79_10750 [Polyangiaceae bacterium]|nr:hypothetical protein [Polyangiaceae bacterium]
MATGVIRFCIWQCLPIQSNGVGIVAGGPGNRTLSSVWLYHALLPGVTPDLTAPLEALNDLHGKEYELGAALYAAGYNPIINTIGKGSTYSNDYIPGTGTYYAGSIAEIQRAWGLIKAQCPDDRFIHIHVVDQGEEEIRYPTSGIPSLWAENVAQSHAALCATIGVSDMQIYVNETRSDITGTNWASLMHTEQLTAALAGIKGKASHLLNRSTYSTQPGNLHFDGPGYQQNGRDLAALIISENPMGSATTYLKNKILDHKHNRSTFPQPANLYLGARIAGAEPSTGGYARKQVAMGTTNFPAITGRVLTLAVAQSFATSSGSWGGTVDEIFLTDSATLGQGNEWGSHVIATPVAMTAASKTLTVPASGFNITFPAGSWVDAEIAATLNHFANGAAETPRATVYGSYWLGDPRSGGTQLGSRAAMTQASFWAAAVGGVAISAADLSLTVQPTATYFAIHDASTNGTLLEVFQVASAPVSGVIQAGRLVKTLS